MPVKTIPQKDKAVKNKSTLTRPWVVVLFNDDVHSFEEVILQVQKATKCSLNDATKITVEAHFNGKAVAFRGSFTDCNRVAGILREIGLIVEIQG